MWAMWWLFGKTGSGWSWPLSGFTPWPRTPHRSGEVRSPYAWHWARPLVMCWCSPSVWGARLSLIGIVVGLVGSLAVTQAIESVLFEVEATDPVTFLAVSVFLLAATVTATWAPAWRAARIDPNAVLREG